MTRQTTLHNKQARCGTTLLEGVVALGILSAAFALGAQALGWSAAQRRLADQRHLALQEAENCLEHVRQLTWAELTNERLARFVLSHAAQQQLEAGQLQVTPHVTSDNPTALRIHVQVQWRTRYGQTPIAVHLITWRYQDATTN